MYTKRDYLTFLEKKKPTNERFKEQSLDIVNSGWIFTPDYAF